MSCGGRCGRSIGLEGNAHCEDSTKNLREREPFMLEALVIIIALGGLEVILWSLDHRQQKKQIELLDSIWAELAIHNSAEEEGEKARKAANQ